MKTFSVLFHMEGEKGIVKTFWNKEVQQKQWVFTL